MVPISVKLQPVVISDKPHEPYIARDDALKLVAAAFIDRDATFDSSGNLLVPPHLQEKLPQLNSAFATLREQMVDGNTPLSPEALAVTSGKTSRSQAGFAELKTKIKFGDRETYQKSLDSVLKHTDYGHASIMGITSGIPIAVDGLSMIMAYIGFNELQVVDGQESSTRYIPMNKSQLPEPSHVGIPAGNAQQWIDLMNRGFELQAKYGKRLDERVRENPDLVLGRLTQDEKEKLKPAMKDRMITNYALDRSRYFIPFTTQTNAVYVTTARMWNEAVKAIDSMPLPEAHFIADLIRKEVSKAAPRFTRHSNPDERSRALQEQYWLDRAGETVLIDYNFAGVPDKVDVEIFVPRSTRKLDKDAYFKGRPNRYAYLGGDFRKATVSTEWNNVSAAEARDLNRHRTGFREWGFVPNGFYLPPEVPQDADILEWNTQRVDFMKSLAHSGNPAFIYAMVLGDQSRYFHSQHLEKAVYKGELRTGLGSHFRYAEHLRPELHAIIKRFPQLEGYVVIGDARPEPV